MFTHLFCKNLLHLRLVNIDCGRKKERADWNSGNVFSSHVTTNRGRRQQGTVQAFVDAGENMKSWHATCSFQCLFATYRFLFF